MLEHFLLLCLVFASTNAFVRGPLDADDARASGRSFLQPAPSNYGQVPRRSAPEADASSVEPPLRIGSFNVQTLAKRKFNDAFIMMIVEKVILRYDLILIMEIMTGEDRFIGKLLRDVNRFAGYGIQYNVTLNEDPTTKEYCALFYRVDKLKILKNESFYDPSQFYRRPFIVTFESKTLRDMSRFCVIGLHVRPDQAVQELNALAGVYDYAKRTHNVDDVLLMGDFNADCTHVKESDWERIALWTRTEFTWLVGHNVDTTTNYRKCALDRFVYAGENLNSGIIASSARSYDYRQDLDLTIDQARAVSDHWPIEVQIRGKLSSVAEKYLSSEKCFTLRDSRARNVPKVSTIVAQIPSFNLSDCGSSIRNETRYSENLIIVLTALSMTFPTVISKEQLEGITYKINRGALEDKSSYGDVKYPIYSAEIIVRKEYSNVLVCKTSTVN